MNTERLKPEQSDSYIAAALAMSRHAHRDSEFAEGIRKILEPMLGLEGAIGACALTPGVGDRSKLEIDVFVGREDVMEDSDRIEEKLSTSKSVQTSSSRVYRSGKGEWGTCDQSMEVDLPFGTSLESKVSWTEPVVVNNWVEGVLQVWWEPDPDLADKREAICEIAGYQVGRVIERDIRNNSFLKLTELHQILVENVTDHAIFMLDPEGRVMTWNRGAKQITGYTAHDIIGEHYSRFFRPEDQERDLPLQLLEVAKERGRNEENGWRVRADGTRFLASTSLSALYDESETLTGYLKIVHDVTDKRELEKQIVGSAIENQRDIAQQIHDGIGQDLTGIVMLSSLLKRKLRKKGIEESAEAERVEEAARKAQASVRLVSRGLLPVDMSSEGLVDGLRDLLRETEELCQVEANLKVDGDVEIRDNVIATNLYYIAKEALNNEIRHGRARTVGIDLECHDRQFRMVIYGNGKGFSNGSQNSEGIGMKTMKHRANILGAELRVRPGKKSGTRVVCSMELDCES